MNIFNLVRILPSINLSGLGRTELYPPRPDPSEFEGTLCLGTKSQALGDALLLTPIAKKLKSVYPNVKLKCYSSGFNPVVFFNNPALDGISFLPRKLYGDDASIGTGHMIQLKEEFFGLPISRFPRPEIHLSASELRRAQEVFKLERMESRRPICIFHPHGKTHAKIGELFDWDGFVSRWKEKIKFWQVGLEGQRQIPGCRRYLLSKRNYWVARETFALISQSDLFFGMDSGPMHVAKAFGVESMVITCVPSASEHFRKRMIEPYFVNYSELGRFLYEDNEHIEVCSLNEVERNLRADQFVERVLSKQKS